MSTETSAISTAETVATTAEQTILQMSPEIIAALAETNPQAAAVATAAAIGLQVLNAAAKQLVTGNITSAAFTAKVNDTAASIQATHAAWEKFAASAGVPDTPVA